MYTKHIVSLLVAVLPAWACEDCYGAAGDVTLARHVRRMQPDALNATDLPNRLLEWGQLNFLHTTDTHGWLEGHVAEQNYGADWGDFVSFTQHMRQKAADYGVDLLLVDTGDLHDGAGLSDATTPNGNVSNGIFENIGYDLLTMGNHELYISNIAYETFTQFAKVYGDRYLTSNVQILNPATNQLEYIGQQYRYFTTGSGIRIMSFGVLYDFTGNSNVSNVTTAADMVKETWFKNAVNFDKPIDLFVVLGHNPVRPSDSECTIGTTVYDAIRGMRPDVPIQIFGGHSHIRDYVVYDDQATGLESGRYCETLGWLSMSGINKTASTSDDDPSHRGWQPEEDGPDGEWYHHGNRIPPHIPQPSRSAVATPFASAVPTSTTTSVSAPTERTFEFHAAGSQNGKWKWDDNAQGWHRGDDHSNNPANVFDRPQGISVTNQITAERNALNLTQLFGCAPQTYCFNCAPYGSSASIFSLLPTAVGETVINQARSTIPRVLILNTGGIRFDLNQGPFTFDDSFIVSPFTDGFQYIPKVPYSAASQVLATLNAQPDSKKRDLSARDFGFESMNMIDQDRCIDPPITTNHLSARSYAGGRILRRQSIVTPGYTTTDDFGTDGDDTMYSAIPSYSIPGYFEGNGSFPTTGTPTAVDLVFLDFIATNVLQALSSLGQTYTMSDVTYYLPNMGPNAFTTQSYLPAYAKLAWQAGVPKLLGWIGTAGLGSEWCWWMSKRQNGKAARRQGDVSMIG